MSPPSPPTVPARRLAGLVARLDRREPLCSWAVLAGLWLLPYSALRLWLARGNSAAKSATIELISPLPLELARLLH